MYFKQACELLWYKTNYPDDFYKVEVDYWALFSACNKEEESKATLEAEDDYIDIPEKYEHVFKMALFF